MPRRASARGPRQRINAKLVVTCLAERISPFASEDPSLSPKATRSPVSEGDSPRREAPLGARGERLRACDLMPNWGHSRFENGSGTPFLEGDSPRKLICSQALRMTDRSPTAKG